MTDPIPARRWERHHANGWIATVEATIDSFYNSAAHQIGGPSAQWVRRNVVDLTFAQRLADEQVPPHDCDCPGWVRRT
jgi:hypothetical protein